MHSLGGRRTRPWGSGPCGHRPVRHARSHGSAILRSRDEPPNLPEHRARSSLRPHAYGADVAGRPGSSPGSGSECSGDWPQRLDTPCGRLDGTIFGPTRAPVRTSSGLQHSECLLEDALVQREISHPPLQLSVFLLELLQREARQHQGRRPSSSRLSVVSVPSSLRQISVTGVPASARRSAIPIGSSVNQLLLTGISPLRPRRIRSAPKRAEYVSRRRPDRAVRGRRANLCLARPLPEVQRGLRRGPPKQ